MAFLENDRMPDTLSPNQRSERMSRIRQADTKPEMIVRRLLHGLGYRYRLHVRALPGRPDLVFPARRKIILVHGCFWHRHPDKTCPLARLPKSRLEFWLPKLEANRARDERVFYQLLVDGWQVEVVWECELRHRSALTGRLVQFLGPH